MPPRPRPGREFIAGHGVLFPGHVADPDVAEAAVSAWLDDKITDKWRRRAVRQKAATAGVTRAYWAGPDIGFVGATHPQAEAVTIVAVPDDALDAGP